MVAGSRDTFNKLKNVGHIMNPVIHFEMPAEDRKRMVSFYASVFGWQTQQLGPEMGDFVLVTTTESDEQRSKETRHDQRRFLPENG